MKTQQRAFDYIFANVHRISAGEVNEQTGVRNRLSIVDLFDTRNKQSHTKGKNEIGLVFTSMVRIILEHLICTGYLTIDASLNGCKERWHGSIASFPWSDLNSLFTAASPDSQKKFGIVPIAVDVCKFALDCGFVLPTRMVTAKIDGNDNNIISLNMGESKRVIEAAALRVSEYIKNLTKAARQRKDYKSSLSTSSSRVPPARKSEESLHKLSNNSVESPSSKSEIVEALASAVLPQVTPLKIPDKVPPKKVSRHLIAIANHNSSPSVVVSPNSKRRRTGSGKGRRGGRRGGKQS